MIALPLEIAPAPSDVPQDCISAVAALLLAIVNGEADADQAEHLDAAGDAQDHHNPTP